MNRIKLWHSQVVAEYLKNGGDGPKAYMAVRGCQRSTARSHAYKLLASPTIQSELARQRAVVESKDVEEIIVNRTTQTQEAHDIYEKALGSDKLDVALRASGEKSRLHNLYSMDTPDTEKYIQFITNILQIKPDKPEVASGSIIDVQAVEKRPV